MRDYPFVQPLTSFFLRLVPCFFSFFFNGFLEKVVLMSNDNYERSERYGGYRGYDD